MVLGLSFAAVIDFFARRTFTAAGLRPETVSVDSYTTIHCWLSPSLSPSAAATRHSAPLPADKPPLLLLHGFGTSTTWQWRAQVPALARHFDLIVPDLIFFGGSTTRSQERSEKFQAEAVAALLKALGIGGGGGRGLEAVVGTSYGGFVAYHLAGMARVEKMVIASSDLGKREEDDRKLMERAGADVGSIAEVLLPSDAAGLRRLLLLAMHRPPPFMPDFLLWYIHRNIYKDNLDEKMELIDGITLGNINDLFQLTPLPQDVLIMWGEHDSIFPLDKAFELKKKLGEKAKLEVLKNTGHMPQVEDPNQFNNVLLSFLLGDNES